MNSLRAAGGLYFLCLPLCTAALCHSLHPMSTSDGERARAHRYCARRAWWCAALKLLLGLVWKDVICQRCMKKWRNLVTKLLKQQQTGEVKCDYYWCEPDGCQVKKLREFIFPKYLNPRFGNGILHNKWKSRKMNTCLYVSMLKGNFESYTN